MSENLVWKIQALIDKAELKEQLECEITDLNVLKEIIDGYSNTVTREKIIKNLFLFYNEEIPITKILSNDPDSNDSTNTKNDKIEKYIKNPTLKTKKLWKLYNLKVYTQGNNKILYKNEDNINAEVERVFNDFIERNDDGDIIAPEFYCSENCGKTFLNIDDQLPLMISDNISYYSALLNNQDSNFSEFLDQLSKRTIHY